MTNQIEDARGILLEEASRLQGYADIYQSSFSETGSEAARISLFEVRSRRDGLMFAVETLDKFIGKTKVEEG